mmetsp:Transcript_7302/g.18852  ORF Transcript_7302/g.18852 Transcript_7302/m.18852 type:complete len:202 (-) Transcript_7302:123-728(-)
MREGRLLLLGHCGTLKLLRLLRCTPGLLGAAIQLILGLLCSLFADPRHLRLVDFGGVHSRLQLVLNRSLHRLDLTLAQLLFFLDHLLHNPLLVLPVRVARSRCVVQLSLEPVDFVLKLAEHRVLGVLIDLGLVLDVLGAVGVAQCAHRLVKVVVRRPHVGNHHGLGVAAQRVLQQPRQLGVAVGDVAALAVHQGADDVAQR